MIKTERDEIMERLNMLYSILVWSEQALMDFENAKYKQSAASIELVINAIEDNEVVENLKNIRDRFKMES